MFPPPREFQAKAHHELQLGVVAGHRKQVLMAPTGGGKTCLALRIAKEAICKGKRVTFVADRTTLIDQTSETAERYGLREHGIIQADHWRFRPHLPFQIASAQTLARREWLDPDVLIVDECHTMYSAMTERIEKTRAVVIGLSATPFTPGMGKLYGRVVNAATMHELTKLGVLVPMRVLSCRRPDMKGAKVNSRGEWDEREVESRGMELLGDIVTEWVKHGDNRKTICFGATISHCESIVRAFNEIGVMAAVFCSRTPDAEREALLAEYRKPNSALRVLVSVEALAKGFDVPDVGCVIDARPLRKSLSTAIQMWGRGLRSSPATGKKNCILLDHSGNILRFREDFESIYFNGLAALDMGEQMDKKVREEPEQDNRPKSCPVCGYTPFLSRCMSCGHERQARVEVAHEAGVATEVVMLGGKKAGDSKEHVWAQCASYARTYSAPEKQQARAACLFRDITGQWPPRNWDIAKAPRVEVSRVVLNKIKQKNIAFKKSLAQRQGQAA